MHKNSGKTNPKKKIFKPLGMVNSTLSFPEERLDEIVSQYTFNENGEAVEKDKHIAYRLGSKYESGGAAGAYYAIDRKNGITVYLAAHVLGSSKYHDTKGETPPIIQDILAPDR